MKKRGNCRLHPIASGTIPPFFTRRQTVDVIIAFRQQFASRIRQKINLFYVFGGGEGVWVQGEGERGLGVIGGFHDFNGS